MERRPRVGVRHPRRCAARRHGARRGRPCAAARAARDDPLSPERGGARRRHARERRRAVTAVRRALLAILFAAAAPVAAQPTRPLGPAPQRESAPPSRTAPAPVNERSRLSIEPSGHAIKRLQIENPLGDVKVEGYDGTAIQIETHKQAPDEDTLDRLHISLVPNPDGTVAIKTTADGGKEFRPVPRGAVRIDLVIRAPRDARVEAAVSSGALEVTNMDAGSDLDTGSGPIWVRNVQGEVLTHSISGRTRLAQGFGSVDAQTLSSDLGPDTIG